MPLFRPSTMPWATAVERIADSAGASGDSEMRSRAHLSLRAAFQHFGGKCRWDFLRGEAVPIPLIAAYEIGGVSASAGQASAACPAGHGLKVDDIIIASGFVLGARVSATAASGFGLTTAITGLAAGVNVVTATARRDFYDAPTDWRHGYSVRLLGAGRYLVFANNRSFGRAVTDEYSDGTPEAYDIFYMGGKGKLKILPPPTNSDTILVRYYRAFTLGSATGVTASLDIPEDYESYVLAWGKWHFLTDKNDRSEQASTWIALASEGLKTMLAEQTQQQDQDLGFTPAYAMPGYAGGDNSTRHIDWNT